MGRRHMKPAPPPISPRPGFPPSPCTRVCTLNADNLCLGCWRTLEEIVAWAGMTAEEQRAVLKQLPGRSQ